MVSSKKRRLNIEKVKKLKEEPEQLLKFVKEKNNGKLIFLLNKLGRLSKDFNKKPLLYLLNHKNDKIRYLSIKNLAKTSDYKLFKIYKKILKSDESSNVRRETVSAIGRLKNKKSIPILIKLLKDRDPEVVLQAIRGLLVFRKDGLIVKKIKQLKNHPNEIIQDLIKKEFFQKNNKKSKKVHTDSPTFLRNKTILADVRDVIKFIPNESIHLTFTSPPYYNARDYSIYKSYNQYLKFLTEVFRGIHRITEEGRFFILNTSPIIIPRVGRKYASKRYAIPYDIHPFLIKMGWEFIDDIIWVKPEASAKNRNGGFLQHRKPLAYKSNSCSEMVMVYRKKTNKLIDWNMKQYKKEMVEKSKVVGKYESSNVWKIDPVFDKIHSAVFPIELCNRVIKFYSYVGDLVFDPFAGSGTLGKAAYKLNRYFLLVEKEKKYFKRIKENFSQKDIINKNTINPIFIDFKEFVSNFKKLK